MNLESVIGREEEISTISRLYASERSEFLAISKMFTQASIQAPRFTSTSSVSWANDSTE